MTTESAQQNRDSAVVRLCAIAKRIVDTKPPGGRQLEGWAMVFEVDKTPLRVLPRLGTLFVQLEDARQEIESWDLVADRRDLFLQPLHQFQSAVGEVNLGQSWDQIKQRLNDGTMTALRFLDSEAKSHGNAKPLSKQQLDTLRSEAAEFLKSLAVSVAPPAIKRVLMTQVASIIDAVDSYSLSGVEGLEAAVERAVGALGIHRAEFTDHCEESCVTGFWDVVSKAHKLVCFARDSMAALPEAGTLLISLMG